MAINISIPEKVKVILSGNMINIEGPLGKKSLSIDLDIFELGLSAIRLLSTSPVHLCIKKDSSLKLSDWFGFKIDDAFVIGYGMDLDGKFRDLDDIYIRKV